MKKIISMLFIALLAIGVVFANGESETGDKAPEKLILRYAEVNSATDERTKATEDFARIVNERTNGRIEIQVFPGGQLGNNKAVIQSLQVGAIDMCNEPPTNLKTMGVNVPYLEALSIPFLFKDVDHAVRVMDGEIGDQLIEDINNSGSGIRALDFFVAGARNFFTKKPCTSLEDFKSLKIRVMQSSIYMDTIKAFGGSPTPTSTAELYSALQTGVVDGAENPVKGYYNNKYYEVAPYYTWSNYMIQPSSMLISEKTWNKLSAEDQQILIDAAAEATHGFQELTASLQEKQIASLKEEGVTFCELEDYDKWVEAAQPIVEKYGKGFEDLIEKIKNY